MKQLPVYYRDFLIASLPQTSELNLIEANKIYK